MGNTLAGEYPSSWQDADVKKWQAECRQRQQCTYLQFEGSQFHDITDLSPALRITKICFAIYGPPTVVAETLEETYGEEQREFGKKIYDKIYETWLKAPCKQFKLGFIFLLCKEGEKEYPSPLFRLCWNTVNNNDENRYIDIACRVYESSNDWKENNCMPMMKYCHPLHLAYTCSSDGLKYEFDADKEVNIAFNTSPACDLVSRIARTADVIISAVGMTVGVVALFSPAGFISAPILLGVGGTSAVYGVGRATQRLIDKATHGERMTDLESFMLYLSIAAAPFHLLSGFASARLAAGAASGRIFSESQRLLATVLLCTSFGIDSFSIILSFVNLIDKYRQDNLSTLDVLQFSVSTLFFLNTLVQPKTAQGVIERAQQQRINAVADSLTDEQARASFKKFMEENKGDGGIKDTSKVVRSLNKMEDPNLFFKSVKDGQSVTIGGRKGKTVIMTSADGQTQRRNPNTVVDQARIKITSETHNHKFPPKVQKLPKVRNCLGEDYETHRHLGTLNGRQKRFLNQAIGGSAGYNKDTIQFAVKVADQMGLHKNPDAFLSIVECVAAEVKKTGNFNYNDVKTFHAGIVKDLGQIKHLATQKGIKFDNEYLALYHYRKHNIDFVDLMSNLKFYLGQLPGDIQRNGKLSDVCTITAVTNNNTTETFTKETFILPNDSMLITIKKDGRQTISTIYKNANVWKEYMDRYTVTNVPPPDVAFDRLAAVAGLDCVRLQVHSNNLFYKNYDFCKNAAELEDYKTMIAMLVTDLADCLDPDSNNNTDDD